MSEKYKAKIDSGHLMTSYHYWEVKVEAQDIDVFNNICNTINLIKDETNLVTLEKEELDKILEANEALIKENEQLKKERYQAPFLKIFDDYFIYYRDTAFSMHKPQDIRGLCFLLNKEHGFNELQCEYNDEEMI